MTVTAKVVLAVAAPSVTLSVIFAAPTALGVTVTVRLLPVPLKTMFVSETMLGAEETAVSVSDAAAVSVSPRVKLIGALLTPENSG